MTALVADGAGSAAATDPVGADASDPGDPGAVELVLALQLVLGRLVRQLRRASPGQVGVSGVSALWTLVNIGGAAGLRSSDLASAENVSAPTMTRVVDHLVAQGLARRSANPEDGRSSLVQVTGDGRLVLEAVRDDRGRYLLGRVATLDAAQLRTLTDALPVLGRLAEPAGPAGSPPAG